MNIIRNFVQMNGDYTRMLNFCQIPLPYLSLALFFWRLFVSGVWCLVSGVWCLVSGVLLIDPRDEEHESVKEIMEIQSNQMHSMKVSDEDRAGNSKPEPMQINSTSAFSSTPTPSSDRATEKALSPEADVNSSRPSSQSRRSRKSLSATNDTEKISNFSEHQEPLSKADDTPSTSSDDHDKFQLHLDLWRCLQQGREKCLQV